MTRTEEMANLRAELFRARFDMNVSVRDPEAYEKARARLKEIKKRLAHLKFEELLEKKNEENKERGMKNG